MPEELSRTFQYFIFASSEVLFRHLSPIFMHLKFSIHLHHTSCSALSCVVDSNLWNFLAFFLEMCLKVDMEKLKILARLAKVPSAWGLGLFFFYKTLEISLTAKRNEVKVKFTGQRKSDYLMKDWQKFHYRWHFCQSFNNQTILCTFQITIKITVKKKKLQAQQDKFKTCLDLNGIHKLQSIFLLQDEESRPAPPRSVPVIICDLRRRG